uniref:50S ribosomal protein L33 n=1 Tax=Noctiluca scintillans TaxID=2966 RepID=A0A7S1ARZ0_NOCSC|mmetsp:Transcript_57488/g.153197  ORF Transcript_57488/g.153197 Transcript_57488/m.153197 type:complete len:104 (+) Transcript_57488:67-378(+)
MLFLSRVLLRSKSKRLAVQLMSSAQTGFFYWTEKSPLKKEVRMALHKYDPVVNRHVMFYESVMTKATRRLKRPRPMSYARWTGQGIQELVKIAAKKFEKTGIL